MRLSSSELWKLSADTFGTKLASTMYSIALAESGGQTDVINNTAYPDRPGYKPPAPGAKPEYSIGPWQINIGPGANKDLQRFDLTDPQQNARAAKIVLDRQGPSAWSTYTKGTYRKHLPGEGGGVSTMTPEQQAMFDALYNQNLDWEQQLDTLYKAQSRLSQGLTLYPDQVSAIDAAKRETLSLAEALATSNPALAQLMKNASGGDASAVTAYVKYLEEQVSTNVGRLYGLDENQAYDKYPERLAEYAEVVTAKRKIAESLAPPAVQYDFEIGPGGQVVRTGSDGTFEIMATHPELAGKNTQVVTDRKSGRAAAVTFDDEGNATNRVDLGQVAFPELDPALKFRIDVLTTAANVEQALAGIEMQRRGMELDALSADMGFQVNIGRMRYEEAQLQLNRIDSALTQQRLTRAEQLKYGVSLASLRTNASGELMTRLPFADQLAGILSSATGRPFGGADFELPVTFVSPDQAARDVIAGSQFESPIPGLQSSLQSTREAMAGVIGAPLPAAPASSAITQEAQRALAVPGVG